MASRCPKLQKIFNKTTENIQGEYFIKFYNVIMTS